MSIMKRREIKKAMKKVASQPKKYAPYAMGVGLGVPGIAVASGVLAIKKQRQKKTQRKMAQFELNREMNNLEIKNYNFSRWSLQELNTFAADIPCKIAADKVENLYPKQDRKRLDHIHMEIFSTEYSYLESLRKLNQENSLNALAMLSQSRQKMTTEERAEYLDPELLSYLIKQSQEIITANEQLLVAFSKYDLKNWNEEIGNLQKLYEDYAKMYSLAGKIPQDVEQEFQLNSILIQPVQRFPRYVMFANDIAKNCSEGDKVEANKFVETCKKITSKINSHAPKQENHTKSNKIS